MSRSHGARSAATAGAGTAWLPVALAITALAFGLRLYRLGAVELWVDEFGSLYTAMRPNWLERTVLNNTPPLYHLCLHFWLAGAGDSEMAVRLPSAVAGAGFVLAVAWLARLAFTPRVAMWSALVAALSPLHIYYSQEARPYAFLMVTLALAGATLWRALERNDRRSWALFAAAATATCYTHLFASLGLAPLAIWPLLWPERGRLRPFLVATLIPITLFVPWFVYFSTNVDFSIYAGDWVEDAWRGTTPLWAVPTTLQLFALGGYRGMVTLIMKNFQVELPLAVRIVGLFAFAAAGALALGPWGDERLQVPWISRRKLMLASALLLPLLALLLASFVEPVYLAGRYDLIAFPPFPILIGLGLAKIEKLEKLERIGGRGRLGVALASAALFVPVAVKLYLYFTQPCPPDHQRTAAAVLERAGHGDLVVFTELRGGPVLYQMRRLGVSWEQGACTKAATGARFGCRIFPTETEVTLASYRPDRIVQEPGAADHDVARYLADLPSPPQRILVLLGTFATSRGQLAASEIDRQLLAALQRVGYRPVAGDVALGLLTLERAGPG